MNWPRVLLGIWPVLTIGWLGLGGYDLYMKWPEYYVFYKRAGWSPHWRYGPQGSHRKPWVRTRTANSVVADWLGCSVGGAWPSEVTGDEDTWSRGRDEGRHSD